MHVVMSADEISHACRGKRCKEGILQGGVLGGIGGTEKVVGVHFRNDPFVGEYEGMPVRR